MQTWNTYWHFKNDFNRNIFLYMYRQRKNIYMGLIYVKSMEQIFFD